jgi:hypothetical protein
VQVAAQPAPFLLAGCHERVPRPQQVL